MNFKDWCWVAVIIGLGLWSLPGCTYKQGYNKGYAKAQEFYATANDPDGKVRMPMYPYGFMRGWEYYKMEKARDAKK